MTLHKGGRPSRMEETAYVARLFISVLSTTELNANQKETPLRRTVCEAKDQAKRLAWGAWIRSGNRCNHALLGGCG